MAGSFDRVAQRSIVWGTIQVNKRAEPIEYEHRLFDLFQVGNALFVFDTILFRENCQRRFGAFARLSVLNIAQIST
jgi:hypothetical protein